MKRLKKEVLGIITALLLISGSFSINTYALPADSCYEALLLCQERCEEIYPWWDFLGRTGCYTGCRAAYCWCMMF